MTERADQLAEHMPAVARALFGDPNPLQSKPGKPRWGRKGSLAIDDNKGIWFDHENGSGGGVLDLIAREKQLTGREAVEWLKSIGCRIDDEGRSRLNGAKQNGLRRPPQETVRKHLLETYDYIDQDGTRLFQVVRFGFCKPDGSLVLAESGKPEKTFRQRRPDPDEPKIWLWGLAAGDYMRRAPKQDWYRFDEANWARLPAGRERKTIAAAVKSVPYRLPDVVETASLGRTVLVVEGEQKADALARWNIPATCNPEGAGKWTGAHAAFLRDADVVILPDNDSRGREHSEAVARSLQGIAAHVRIIELPGLGPREDIIDWQKAGHSREELCALIEQAPEWKSSHRPSTSPLESAPASTFKMSGIRWLWENRFALGKLGLIGGLPDRGKGLIAADMIARTTNGDRWPCGEGRAVRGNVLLLTAEDDIEDTVVPRLVAASANLDRVHILKMVRQGEGKRMFSLVTDLALLLQKINEVGDVVLIIIDPMSAYLGVGKVDSFRATDVRGVLSPLTDLAAEKKLALIGVMHFNKKADVHNAMLRISDSLAFVAAARHCYVVVDDAENERRLFVKAKNNLAPDTKALSYSVGVATVGQDDQTRETISAPHILWGSEHVNVTATEAMEAEATAKSSSSTAEARETAKKFLLELLAAGPVAKRDVDEAAEANCITMRTLERAKAELGVVAKKAGLKEGWTWHLPEPNKA